MPSRYRYAWVCVAETVWLGCVGSGVGVLGGSAVEGVNSAVRVLQECLSQQSLDPHLNNASGAKWASSRVGRTVALSLVGAHPVRALFSNVVWMTLLQLALRSPSRHCSEWSAVAV